MSDAFEGAMTARRKLPVMITAARAWILLARDWWTLLRILWVPVGLIVALDFYVAKLWHEWFGASHPAVVSQDIYFVRGSPQTVIMLLFAGVTVAIWHRTRLSGSRFPSMLRLLTAWPNLVSLTLHWCGLILVTIGLEMVFRSPFGPFVGQAVSDLLIRKLGLVNYPAIYRILMDLVVDGLPLLIALYIPGRLGLMLWALPAGSAITMDGSWRASTGNGWRIAGTIFLAMLPIMITDSALPPDVITSTGFVNVFLWHDLSTLLQLFVAVGVIAAISGTLLGGRDKAQPDADNPV